MSGSSSSSSPTNNKMFSMEDIAKMNNKNTGTYLVVIIVVVLVLYGLYNYYIYTLNGRNCDFMSSTYSDLDGHIVPISKSDPDCSGNMFDYYIKTAYNACSGGSYRNDFVDVCNLKAVIRQGVRCLDFQVFSLDSKPVVATSTSSDYFVKETFNHVYFGDVMRIINDYAFSDGTCPNPTDPIIIHLRIFSTNQKMFDNLTTIFSEYDKMLGRQFSDETDGENLGKRPLTDFMGKIILAVDRSNTAFLESSTFTEFVNITSNSIFMRSYRYYDIVNNPDVAELTDFNRSGMTIVLPDNEINPSNPSGFLCRMYGCQMVAMRYQYVDNFLLADTIFFQRGGYAFVLKPPRLRYIPLEIRDPRPQDKNLSYETRTFGNDYFSMDI